MGISFLIATKNSAKTIGRCLESVFSVVEPGDEIIICDASSDDTLSIVKERFNSTTVRIINGSGIGIYEDRLLLMDAAKTEYLYFVDSDDQICTQSFLLMRKTLSPMEPDIIFFDSNISAPFIRRGGFDNEQNNISEISKEEADEIFYSSDSINALWTKIFKKTLFINEFDKHIQFGEDRLITMELLSNSRKIYYFHQVVYKRIFSLDSATSKIKESYLFDHLQMIEITYDFLNFKSNAQFIHLFRRKMQPLYISRCIFLSYKLSDNRHTFLKYRSIVRKSFAWKSIKGLSFYYLFKPKKMLLFIGFKLGLFGLNKFLIGHYKKGGK
jgi:glycosyltransferase involved in cell wall biosynthesis